MIETHSHGGPANERICSVALSDGHDHAGTAGDAEFSISGEVEFCQACMAGQREGVLDASRRASRSRPALAPGVPATDDFAVSSRAARPSAPRGPPTV
ncbi:MAG: hypothetical protein AAF725_09060 [Acidobacteriota bacterium]